MVPGFFAEAEGQPPEQRRKGHVMAYIPPPDHSGDAEDPARAHQQWMGPGQVDHMLRQAIEFCWMALPQDRRSVDEVESQMRRLMDRALKDLREDAEAFGPGGPSGPTEG